MTAEQLKDEDLASLSRKILHAQIPTKLWPFTDEEERRIEHAKIGAIRFMANFGQAPKQPQIDLSHYANVHKYDWYGRN